MALSFSGGSVRISDEVEARVLEEKEFDSYFNQFYRAVFTDRGSFAPGSVLSDAEKASLKLLRKNMGRPVYLRVGLFARNEFIGWHTGDQRSGEEFYMRNTGVLSAWRGRGIYKALLPHVIDCCVREGFQVISSKHNATNNPVIIPKLRAGFVITGLELSDRFGTMIRLEYFTNAKRRQMMDYRSGQIDARPV